MNGKDPTKPPRPPATPAPADGEVRSGEGADTALKALIRKRKQVETPDGADPQPPGKPKP